ncbi:hypothetical protein CAOG_04674 [Capsaspora owczarzaki ATCC 30864]|uniref:Uncharacterized protein n=1 Tax=Capsaspora owczarzaki (strain ATCC 30864) TaxID=595528 RepID=A0A0D2WQJ8_CAPO3|nr:hypothetical protein CAOG_04674 [Capsaspora owczarzaki ATCC 30864]KJE93965.1 hypothetical protein CAOG_004674 [Capsaspora owczarzaki ATCC 30864]|eukprot:XP_004347421.1 hypothetical protein CAOG_04674 [Capsaspora owczarzaki ATCC 30864]
MASLLIQLNPNNKYHFEEYRVPSFVFHRTTLMISSIKATLAVAPLALQRNPDNSPKVNPRAIPSIWARTVLRELCVISTKTCLQRLVLNVCTLQTASHFMKSLPASAVRKVARYDSKLIGSLKVARAGLAAHLLTHLALFVVEEVIDLYTYYRSLKENGDDQNAKEKFINKTDKNLVRLIGSVALGALGSAIGTLIKPDLGTRIGGLIGDTILYL